MVAFNDSLSLLWTRSNPLYFKNMCERLTRSVFFGGGELKKIEKQSCKVRNLLGSDNKALPSSNIITFTSLYYLMFATCKAKVARAICWPDFKLGNIKNITYFCSRIRTCDLRHFKNTIFYVIWNSRPFLPCNEAVEKGREFQIP